MARPKISSQGIEVFTADQAEKAVVSSYGVEVFHAWSATSPATPTGAGISAYGVEVFPLPSGLPAFLSGYGVEVFYLEFDVPDAGGGGDSTKTFGWAS